MKDIPFTVEIDESSESSASQGEGAPRNPGSSRGGIGSKGRGEPPTLTVTQLTRRIRGLLEEGFASVLVEGELSNVKQAASGHLYFNLKDEGAQIRCVMFRAAAASLRFEAEDGLQAVVRGRISVYETRGEYQIQVLVLEPKGVGALQLAFEQLKAKLESEGLFDPARKRPPPFLPRCIGIVTSPRGAVIRDMLHVLERRFPGMPVLIAPAVVQGDAAPGEVAGAIALLNQVAEQRRIDILIVGRGGGSVEDLWAFNTEEVARAIHASRVPVISAVGHEVDFTIADFVADVRAPTPSAAAELAVPVRDELRASVNGMREMLFRRVEQTQALGEERWQSLAARLSSPEEALRQWSQRLDDLDERALLAARVDLDQASERSRSARERLLGLRPDRFHTHHRALAGELVGRLSPALHRALTLARERMTAQMGLLDSLSPLTVMKRGYAALRHADGRAVNSVKDVAVGDAISARLADGSLEAEVMEVRRDDGELNGQHDSG
ncbi:MAG: exodeoxyribonuclease VII large subunit [bacterium]